MNRRSTTHPSLHHEIYPKRYFDASPTWFAWNNITAEDVRSLRTHPGFEGQQIYFHLNHPIRFVRIVGVVVDVEVKIGKFVLISVDDGSGACMEVKTSLREVKEVEDAVYPSNTLVDSLDVHLHFGVPKVSINKQRIDIGSIVKAKGALDSFRNIRQLKLERIWIVKDTNEEVKAWAETAAWKRDVLSKPWVLTLKERDEIDEKIRQEEIHDREKSKKRRARDAKYAEAKKRKLEKLEMQRKQEEKKFNEGALPGSNLVPMRVTDS